MKKVTDFLRPNILIFFGALLFLLYLNLLSINNGTAIAMGVIATVISVYYLTVGILGIIIGDKFSPMLKKIFDVISVSLFAIFMFVLLLLTVIGNTDNMGPTAWIIAIFSMAASLALLGFYPVARFVDKPFAVRFGFLFSAIFCLALLLNVLFTEAGAARNLGGIPIMYLAVYLLFALFLFGSLQNADAKEEKAPNKNEKEE